MLPRAISQGPKDVAARAVREARAYAKAALDARSQAVQAATAAGHDAAALASAAGLTATAVRKILRRAISRGAREALTPGDPTHHDLTGVSGRATLARTALHTVEEAIRTRNTEMTTALHAGHGAREVAAAAELRTLPATILAQATTDAHT